MANGEKESDVRRKIVIGGEQGEIAGRPDVKLLGLNVYRARMNLYATMVGLKGFSDKKMTTLLPVRATKVKTERPKM